MRDEGATIEHVLEEILRLPSEWHGAGSLRGDVLRSIARHAAERDVRFSAETGTGKSTLLLSHLSPHHTVFAKDDRGDGDSLTNVQQSALLRREVVNFVVGPTQRMLPGHQFDHPLQLVLLDGPHGYPFPELEYYYLYPHLSENALLIVDDIQLPTVFNFFCFLREDEMFRHVETVHHTAFLSRTEAPVFDQLGDGWWLQAYNKKRYPVVAGLSPVDRLKGRIPLPLRSALKRLIARFR
jgi:hypothetical protein